MKKIVMFLMALALNALMGSMGAMAMGVDAGAGALCMNIISIAASATGVLPAGILPAGVYTEVWTGEIVKQFNAGLKGSFMDGLPNYNQFVENDVLHLLDAGVDPDVIINNTTYPIPLQELNDSDIAISLDKLTTKTTPITDDELYAISYDKIALVKEKHGNSLIKGAKMKGIHAFAPASHTANTPVLATTGEVVDGRYRLTRADIVKLKTQLDKSGVPEEGRRLVLCSDHVEDLLLVDQLFAQQYYNYTTGKIANVLGFEIYTYISNPLYTSAGVKKSLGAIASTGEYQASVCFVKSEMFTAAGSTKMYYSEAKTDPDYHRNKVNFEKYQLSLPKKQRAIGAIYSAQEVVEAPTQD